MYYIIVIIFTSTYIYTQGYVYIYIYKMYVYVNTLTCRSISWRYDGNSMGLAGPRHQPAGATGIVVLAFQILREPTIWADCYLDLVVLTIHFGV